MISFAMTDEQEAARDAMRGFADAGAAPAARATATRRRRSPTRSLAQAWELGLTATQLPEAYGGYGAPRSPVTNAIVLEELAYGDATLAIAAAAPSVFAYAIADQGSEAQRAALPARASAASAITAAALAVAEPHPGVRRASRRAPRAERNGNGFVLSGTQVLRADRRPRQPLPRRGAQRRRARRLHRAARRAPGSTISDAEKNLGLQGAADRARSSSTASRVPAADRLGGAGRRRRAAPAQPEPRRASPRSSTASRAPCSTTACPTPRSASPSARPIARKQSIAFRLAEMHMEVESMRWMIWKAASQLEQRRRRDPQRPPGAHLRRGEGHVDRRQRRPGARRPRLHPRASGGDVVPQRPHARRARRARDRLSIESVTVSVPTDDTGSFTSFMFTRRRLSRRNR